MQIGTEQLRKPQIKTNSTPKLHPAKRKTDRRIPGRVPGCLRGGRASRIAVRREGPVLPSIGSQGRREGDQGEVDDALVPGVPRHRGRGVPGTGMGPGVERDPRRNAPVGFRGGSPGRAEGEDR